MPRNTKGGNKAKKGKNFAPKPFITKDKTDDQHYAKVTKVLGNCRFEVVSLTDDKTRLGHIRGKLRKRAWTGVDDIVIISLRDFQDDKCDITHKYDKEEVTKLIKMGEIKGANQEDKSEDCSFLWDEI